jgi:hypothetical protein
MNVAFGRRVARKANIERCHLQSELLQPAHLWFTTLDRAHTSDKKSLHVVLWLRPIHEVLVEPANNVPQALDAVPLLPRT